ncbi:MAG: hypothetical protein ABSA79_10150 [Candidatus Bathyarchaeia archaeon]
MTKLSQETFTRSLLSSTVAVVEWMSMGKALALLIVALFLTSLVMFQPAPMKAQTQNSLVFDDFNGANLDSGKWTIEQGPKESSGSVTVADSFLSLTSDEGGFPRVVSATDPFPATGDFAVDFDITYTRITDWGDGIWISQGPFVPSQDHIYANILQVWATTTDGVTMYLLGKEVYRDSLYTHPTPWGYWNTSKIEIRLQYSNAMYTLFTNGVEVASGASGLRADVFGFGLCVFPGMPSSQPHIWSNFKTDSVRVLPSASVTLSSSPISPSLGFKVDIKGSLMDKDKPLPGSIIVLSYLISGVTTWQPITSAATDSQGAYIATWSPTATGTYLLKAEWQGDENHGGTYTTRNVSVARGTGDALFLNSALIVSVSLGTANLNVGQTQLLTATAIGGSGIYTSYQWYVDGASQSGQTASTFNFSPISAGSYLITATVTDSTGATSSQSTVASITALATPTPTPTASPTSTPTPAATPTPTPTVPEFQSWIILLSLAAMTGTFLLVHFKKQKH